MSDAAEAAAPAGDGGELTISQLAVALEVTPRAIRFYESAGLIQPRRIGTMRVYGHRDRARLLLVLRGKRLGFSLAEIREWLECYALADGQIRQTRLLLERVRSRMRELERQRGDIDLTLEELGRIEQEAIRHLGAGSGGRRSGAGAEVRGRPRLTT